MKKVLFLVFGALGLAVIACAGFFFLIFRTGEKHQEKFFSAVLSGDPKQVTALFEPALVKEVDEPVLALWMGAVRSNLGDFKGLEKTAFATSTRVENGVQITESKGTVTFAKGTAKSELKLRDGKIVGFHVTSDQLDPKKWFADLRDTTIYRKMGGEFLKKLLSNDEDGAFALMHKNLQKQMPLDKLKASIPPVKKQLGEFKSTSFDSEKFHPGDTPRLLILFNIECEKEKATAEVGFDFVGMKGHLILFNVPAGK